MSTTDDESRTAFERWCVETSIHCEPTAKRPDGVYVVPFTRELWTVWQACARTLVRPVEAVPEGQEISPGMVFSMLGLMRGSWMHDLGLKADQIGEWTPRQRMLYRDFNRCRVALMNVHDAALPQAPAVPDDMEQYIAAMFNMQGWRSPGRGGNRELSLQMVAEIVKGALSRLVAAPTPQQSYQDRVAAWMLDCFTPEISADRAERNHRFLEEALELVQSLGCTDSEAHQLVDYVFGRPVGEPRQEVGGVAVTLAALCGAARIDMRAAAEDELARIIQPEVVVSIREKQRRKPAIGPLPGVYPERAAQEVKK